MEVATAPSPPKPATVDDVAALAARSLSPPSEAAATPTAATVAPPTSVDGTGQEGDGDGPSDGDGGGRGAAPPGWRRPLHRPEDDGALCDLVCLVRRQIEVFVATEEDVARRAPRAGVRDSVDVGRVGVRCVHCREPPGAAPSSPEPEARSDGGGGAETAKRKKKAGAKAAARVVRGSVSYPKSIRLVYQAVRNFQRNHLLSCPCMPRAIKDEFLFLRQYRVQGRSNNAGSQYWEDSLRSMGLLDTDRGIRMRDGADGGDAAIVSADEEAGRLMTTTTGASATATAAAPPSAAADSGRTGMSEAGHASSADGPAVAAAAPRRERTAQRADAAAAAAAPPPLGGSEPPDVPGPAATLGARTSGGAGAATPAISVAAAPAVSVAVAPQLIREVGLSLAGSERDSLSLSDEPKAALESEFHLLRNALGLGDGGTPLDRSGSSWVEADASAGATTDAAAFSVSERDSSLSGDRPAAAAPLREIDARRRTTAESGGRAAAGTPPEVGAGGGGRPAAAAALPLPGETGGPRGTSGPLAPTPPSRGDGRAVPPAAAAAVAAGAAGRGPGGGGGASFAPTARRPAAPPWSEPPAIVASDASNGLGPMPPPSGSPRTSPSERMECAAVAPGPDRMECAAAAPPLDRDICLNIPAGAPSLAATTTLSKEAVLERTELACSTVRAVAEMRGGAGPDRGGGEDPTEELRALGAELYELFSGRRPFGDDVGGGGWAGSPNPADDDGGSIDGEALAALLDADEAEDDDESSSLPLRRRRQKKTRGPRPEGRGARRREFVPLSELGLPASLCSLVSSLLEAKSGGAAGDGNGDGHFNGNCVYSSVEKVEEDLRLLATRPERFLYDPVVAGAGGASDFRRPDIAPDALYGRDGEVSVLLEAYDRAATRPVSRWGAAGEMVLVAGYSGSGKSALVRKARAELARRGARFVSAKFDAMHRFRPLFPIVQALDEFFDSLQLDAPQMVEGMRLAIANAVGSEGRVLISLIPSLGRSIGVSCPSPVQVSRTEAKQRLLFLFRMLFRAMCNSGNPIMFFLDDLHWADESSLELLRFLVTDSQIEGLLFVGAYRDNEVGPDHPLMLHLQDIERSGQVNVSTVQVGNLDRESVNSLVSDALHLLPRRTLGLAEEVLHKTGGNALFVRQFLVSLCDEGLLHFSLSTRQWEWDIGAIREKDIAENVVELMTAKILRLAPEVNLALRVAAVFGAQCNEDLLRIIDRAPGIVVSNIAALDVAISEGLMVKARSAYHFPHDQIHHAAYLLIPEPERDAFHLQIGRLLKENSSEKELEAYLFVVVDQLHRGASLITDHEERVNLAKLSLSAGKQATEMSAFLPAAVYFKAGIRLIVEDDWKTHRELCFHLYDSCAEVECVLGHFENIKGHLRLMLTKSTTLEENLRAYFTLIQSMGAQGNKSDAVNTAIRVLGLLGEPFPSEVNKVVVQQELVKTQQLLGTRTKDDLLNMETMHDVNKKEAMKFLNLTVLYDYSGSRAYLPLLVCRMVQLSLLHGVCRESSMGFACYGFIVSGALLNDHSAGTRFGKLALAMLNRFNAKELLSRVFGVVHGYVSNWTEPMQSSLPCLKEAIDVGLSTGDTEWAMLNAHLYAGTAIHSGYPLDKLVDEMKEHSKQMLEYNKKAIYTVNAPVRQTALNLIGRSADPVKLAGEEMDEDILLLQNAEEKRYGILRPIVCVFRLWLAYLFGEYELASELAQKNRCYGESSMSRFVTACCQTFYSGLVALVLARKEGPNKYESAIEDAVAQMELWASSSPWNCKHKLELMKAEYAYLMGDASEAVRLYHCAIDLARKHHFIHEQALALELAGIFYLENGDHATASGLFGQAYECYIQWGALSKAAHLKELYL